MIRLLSKIIKALLILIVSTISLVASTELPRVIEQLNRNVSERRELSKVLDKGNVATIADQMRVQIDSMKHRELFPYPVSYDFERIKKQRRKSLWWTIGGAAYWAIGALGENSSDDDEERKKNAKLIADIGLVWTAIAGSFYVYHSTNYAVKRFKVNSVQRQNERTERQNVAVAQENSIILSKNIVKIDIERDKKIDSLSEEFQSIIENFYQIVGDMEETLTPINVSAECFLDSTVDVITTTDGQHFKNEYIGLRVEIDSMRGFITDNHLQVDTMLVKVSKPFSGWISNKYISGIVPLDTTMYVDVMEASLWLDTTGLRTATLNMGDKLQIVAEFENLAVVTAGYYSHVSGKFETAQGILNRSEISKIAPKNRVYDSEVWIKKMEFNLRDGPGESYIVKSVLTMGTSAKLRKIVDSWANVVLSSNPKENGWVHISGISHTFVKEPKSIWMKRLVDVSAYIETTSLAPIDYQIIFSLKNKTNDRLQVTFEISAINYRTLSLFLSTNTFKKEIGPNGYQQYFYRPSQEIDDLRDAIASKGANLTKSEIKALTSYNFEVDTKVMDVKVLH